MHWSSSEGLGQAWLEGIRRGLPLPDNYLGRMAIEAAAWVPDDDTERSWDDAADLAVEWILQEASMRGERPLLITPTQSQWDSADSITWMAHHHEAATPRGTRPIHGHRPVLVYVPDYDVMSYALQFARGSAIAVVEELTYPLRGWAALVEARNLVTGEVDQQPLSPDVESAYERIHFNGNNGWTSGFGADQTRRILRSLGSQGAIDRDDLLGRMLAKGHNARHLKRLAALVDRL